jgi:hypothetical protein
MVGEFPVPELTKHWVYFGCGKIFVAGGYRDWPAEER